MFIFQVLPSIDLCNVMVLRYARAEDTGIKNMLALACHKVLMDTSLLKYFKNS
jgi:hypothetical protein